MVTGLAIGTETTGLCDVCNFDYEWLMTKPSSLIWADKIIITPYINEVITTRSFATNDNFSQAIRKIFEIAKDFDLLEIKNPKQIINEDISQKILNEIEFDNELLAKIFPKSIQKGTSGKVPGQIFIDGKEFCRPSLWSIYASLYLAKEWKAESLFSNKVYDYCKYKFGLSLITRKNSSINAFNDVFNLILPEEILFSSYIFRNENPQSKCGNCENMNRCEKQFISDTEKKVHKYLELRDRDEIQQIKRTIQEIIEKLEKSSTDYSQKEIINEFHSEGIKINKDLKKTFPKIQRWTNLSLIASTPMTLLGIATGLPSVSYLGASIAGVSGALKEMIVYSKNKYKWVAFLNKRQKQKIKPEIKNKKTVR